MDLLVICEMLIECSEPHKKAFDKRKKARDLQELHIGPDILHLTTKGKWYPVKSHKLALHQDIT